MGEGGKHNLLAEFDGVPLVRRSALIALAADTASVIVVMGHRRSEIGAALDGLALTFIDNPDYASGMASSLIAGFSSRDADGADGILVMLADTPGMPITRPDLPLQSRPAGQAGADQGARNDKSDTSTLHKIGQFNFVATLYVTDFIDICYEVCHRAMRIADQMNKWDKT
jgi:bifunctional N-acetylglucosamine-1-phosphate-uridyltransferase/glucosamine-1-phosphate-acetyltransferase GlmU-like protein